MKLLFPTRRAATALLPLIVLLCGPARGEGPAAKITYNEHVRAIFREHCFSCHNQNKAKNDLALDSFAGVMKGGASGEVIKAGDLEESYLWKLVSHEDEPHMPPAQDKLPEAKLNVIKAWILGGALKDAGSQAVASARPKKGLDMALSAGAGKPAGAPIIPVGLEKKPLVHATRPGPVVSLAASPWSPVVALGGAKQIALYRTDTAELLGILPFADGVPYSMHFSRSGAVLLAAGGHAARQGRAVAYDARDGKKLFELGDELDAVLGADIDSSHKHVAMGGPDRLLRIYSAADGSLVRQLKKHTDWILAVEYSPDGVLLASADRAGGVTVWEASTGQEYQGLEGHTGAVTDLSWRGDSNVLATASEDGTIRLWEMQDGKTLRRLTAHSGGVLAVKFAHDGRLVSAGRDRMVKIWSADGRQLRAIGPLPDLAVKATFDSDGRRVITGDWTGQVTVWDAATGKELGRLAAPGT